MSLKKLAAIVVPVIALAFGASESAQVSVELVVNGSFELTTPIVNIPHPSSASGGQLGFNISANSWTNINNGYNFVFA